jgi:hypothetical protein
MKFLASAASFAAVALTGSMFAQPAMAAPFCLKSQVLAPLCIYQDALDCGREAARQGATCAANPAEIKLTTGVGQYCVVTSSQISVCAYADRTSCARDAVLQRGTCVDAPQTAPARTPDPYSSVNGN